MLPLALKYTFKVWLTSVAVSPFIYLFISAYEGDNHPNLASGDIFLIFPSAIGYFILEMILSFLTWLAFVILTWIALDIIRPEIWLKLFLSVSGISLTVATFCLWLSSPSDGFYPLMLCNAATVTWGTFFYNLQKYPTSSDPLNS